MSDTLRAMLEQATAENAALRERVAELEGVIRTLGMGASASLDEDQCHTQDGNPHEDHARLADWVMSTCIEAEEAALAARKEEE